MPQTAAATRTTLADRALNPSRTVGVATASGGGQVVILTLVYQGATYNAEDLFDALEARYGAGKVTSDRDVNAQGQLHLRIKP